MPYNKHMQDIYKRLKNRGFDASFLRHAVLPDWWEDDLAANPANRALAEATIAKQLGFRVAELRDQGAELSFPALMNFRLRRNGNADAAELRTAALIAQRFARTLCRQCQELPNFPGRLAANDVRRELLKQRPVVDLQALVDFAWSIGVLVAHIHPDRMPKSIRRFQGLAMFCDRRPMILLGHGTDSPPRLAFHLAHELGHLLLGHVTPSDPPLIDSVLEQVDDEPQERDADAFALTILTGLPNPQIAKPQYELSGKKLAAIALSAGPQAGADPGIVALVYGRTNDRWPVAQNALKALGQDHGAHETIARALGDRLHEQEMPESTERFVTALAGTEVE
ncbi:MAG: ImmA/IrrE family metallo-endopeptidase [Phycisphaeraceae bacterium]